MVDFFREGGWGMWTILAFGMVTVGAALRYAYSPGRKTLPFIIAMSVTLLVTTAHATWSDLAAVFSSLVRLGEEGKNPDELRLILFQGLKECTRPGCFAGLFLTLSWLLVSVGMLRQPATAPPASDRSP
ncbi:hypothetical protein LVJ94_23235 [Pendulispora rubella]|uniref:Uncharacterized protein n=1 Tax=Pendulispora rubella TaxID=2741070 RepID=A0ABZ2LHB1_9BACT